MRSRHVDKFNHDGAAVGYDQNVLDESDPIRTGYLNVLDWVIDQARITPDSIVVDLGSGTGNTSQRIPSCRRLICVDISEQMTGRARPKLAHLESVSFVTGDLLEFFDGDVPDLDAVVSTYAIHHLTEREKPLLFEAIACRLKPGGRAVFGDLMFENRAAKRKLTKIFKKLGNRGVTESFEEEFFWFIDKALESFRSLGLHADARRFSDLSWGIVAKKPAQGA